MVMHHNCRLVFKHPNSFILFRIQDFLGNRCTHPCAEECTKRATSIWSHTGISLGKAGNRRGLYITWSIIVKKEHQQETSAVCCSELLSRGKKGSIEETLFKVMQILWEPLAIAAHHGS